MWLSLIYNIYLLIKRRIYEFFAVVDAGRIRHSFILPALSPIYGAEIQAIYTFGMGISIWKYEMHIAFAVIQTRNFQI